MENRFKAGDRLRLLKDRGLNRQGDILTVQRTDDYQIITEEMYSKDEHHYMSTTDEGFYFEVVEEEIYEIY